MPNYKNGKIYKLISNEVTKCYVGSTTQKLSYRKGHHVKYCKLWLQNEYKYISSFEICKFNDCKIILIENYPCNSKEELLKREQYWIDELECVNKQRAYRSIEDLKKYEKKKYINNKDKIIERSKKRYQLKKNDILNKQSNEKLKCPCGSIIRKCGKSRHYKSIIHKEYEEIKWLLDIDY